MDRAGWNYPPGDLRVSDADRDRALSELSEAFRLGRITAGEFDQRSGQALGARTGQELAALLGDLPLEHAPAARTSALERAHRVFATRVAVAAVAATCFTAVAAGNALSHGPSLQQREFARAIAVRQGLPVPPGFPPSPGFDWAGTITPGAIAVLLVVLIIYLRMRMHQRSR
jgi:Domain of unknown function (DUF1707)